MLDMSLQMLECQNHSFLGRMHVGIKQLVKSTAALVVYLWGGELLLCVLILLLTVITGSLC